MYALDDQPCGVAPGDGFRLFMAGRFSQYGDSVIHHDTFSTILSTIHEELNGSIQAQLNQQYGSTRQLGWTGPSVSVLIDLVTTYTMEYPAIPVSVVPPAWYELVRMSVVTRAFLGMQKTRDIEMWTSVHVLTYNFCP